MPLPALALPIAGWLARKFAPRLVGRIAGKRGERIAEQVLTVAGRVVGVTDPEEIRRRIEADPAHALALEREMNALERDVLHEETVRLSQINETMRAEYASADPYVRRARPTWMYVASFTWLLQTLGLVFLLGYGVIAEPARLGELVTAAADLMGAIWPMWAVALSVLGVYVGARSRDKQVAAGQAPQGAFNALASVFQRRG